MPVRLTETYLRQVIRQELKEMMGDFASDPQERVEQFLASNAGKTVTIGQIADETDLAFDEVIDALVEIQIYYDDYDAPNINMDLLSVPVMIDADFQMETDESPLAESTMGRDQLKQKLKSYLGSKPSGVSISTLATKFGVSEKEIKGAARSEGLSVQNDKVMFRKPI